MGRTARLLVAVSGAILISLGLRYGLAALAYGQGSLGLLLVLGGYAAALFVVGSRLALGRVGRWTLGLAIILPAIPVTVVGLVWLFALEIVPGADLSLPIWLLALAGTVCSVLALLATRRGSALKPA